MKQFKIFIQILSVLFILTSVLSFSSCSINDITGIWDSKTEETEQAKNHGEISGKAYYIMELPSDKSVKDLFNFTNKEYGIAIADYSNGGKQTTVSAYELKKGGWIIISDSQNCFMYYTGNIERSNDLTPCAMTLNNNGNTAMSYADGKEYIQDKLK